MAVNISGLRRNLKNVAHNYTDAQVKVREATSNDPWGPSSTVMSEIADLTYNAVAFSEIMQMVWKRLNDHGKNWRHVYKALVLLEYLIKTGSDKVAQQCKENIFAIQTLKDFQYFDDNKDQGINVREKAKALVSLLKDDERLKNERIRALKAKERFTQSTAGIGNDTIYNTSRDRFEGQNYRQGPSPSQEFSSSELESARPQTAGEEELQLQLALAMSREEADKEETKTKSDDMRLAIALQKSKIKDGTESDSSKKPLGAMGAGRALVPAASGGSSALLDLVDINFESGRSSQQPPSQPPPPLRTAASLDPWGFSASGAEAPIGEPLENSQQQGLASGGISTNNNNNSSSSSVVPFNDPWSPQQLQAQNKPAFPENGVNEKKDPWTTSAAETLPLPLSKTNNDPWAPSTTNLAIGGGGAPTAENALLTDPNPLSAFDLLRNKEQQQQSGGGGVEDSFLFNDLDGKETSSSIMRDENRLELLPEPAIASNNSSSSLSSSSTSSSKPKKTVVESLLNEHSNLVNLDNLVSGGGKSVVLNPFEQNPPNPFHGGKSSKPAMNQLLQNQSGWSNGTSSSNNNNNNNLSSATNSSTPKPSEDFNPFF
eukprot:TRINITY_DN1605_c0_g1_i4.p1 TRINITY_DN1605_c0_g1~~TRINITY_DN1605_c0_g1_i4.p1  ORF type:complete len:601 (-),score=213.44 TRINITY_DN1605_c0_g1_i4:690-2492(-)